MNKKVLIWSIIAGTLASLSLTVKPISKLIKIKNLKEWAKVSYNWLKNKYNLPFDSYGTNTSMIKRMGLDRWNAEKLNSLVPEFRTIVRKILEDGKKEGYDKLMIFETIRPLDRQVDLYFKGTALGVFMSKKGGHAWGRAADIVWYDPPKNYWEYAGSWNKYLWLKKEAEKYGLYGPWSNDQVHIQLQTALTSQQIADINTINTQFFNKVKEMKLA